MTAPAQPTSGPTGPLPLDDGDLARCVACGLCLPHCPTWRVTGREMASPRGRIGAMRAVQWRGAPVDDAFERMMEECVQCRGCEPVCPAFVPFGHLMEGAREALDAQRRARRPWTRRAAEWVGYRLVLPRHRLLVALTWALWLLQRLRLAPRRLGLPRISGRALARPMQPSPEGGEPVVLFTGCVMDAWMRSTHRSAQRLVEAAGGAVRLPGREAACCGALHVHAGRVDQARRLARRVIAATPPDMPVLVDSAGCGAALKEYGRLLGTPEAEAFAERVLDVHEWLAARHIDGVRRSGRPVVVQDPCHLRHVQHADHAVRTVLAQAYDIVEIDDEGLCCGAGGAYGVLQPALSGRIRDRKVEALRRAGGPSAVVASANPGCAMHLAAGGVDARHPVDLLAEALNPKEPR